MAPFMNYFGLGSSYAPPTKTQTNKKTPVRALPAAWYTSPEVYELERRSIFSRKWLFTTHQSRLSNAGDFLRYDIAGFNIIVIRDRHGCINAFHNICRHRAYTVVEEAQGNKKILSCRYHGWSYGLNGKLAKAPDYDRLHDFDKDANGLLPVHLRIDRKGFVWVNLDSNEEPEVSWDSDFVDVDNQPRFSEFNFDDYVLDHTYDLEAGYNWKLAADNFNECYHCKTTHPDVPTFMTIDSHDVAVKAGHMQHDQAASPEQKAKGFDVNSTYYFPHTSMSVSPHFMMIQSFFPQSPGRTKVHYQVFRNQNSSDADFAAIAETYARVMREDKALCERAQTNLDAGVLVRGGELHPRWEKGPLFFQQTVREVVTEHFRKEKEAKREIWPASRRYEEIDAREAEDMEICDGLGCGLGKEGGALAW